MKYDTDRDNIPNGEIVERNGGVTSLCYGVGTCNRSDGEDGEKVRLVIYCAKVAPALFLGREILPNVYDYRRGINLGRNIDNY